MSQSLIFDIGKQKSAIVYGFGKSGISAAVMLAKLDWKVYGFDDGETAFPRGVEDVRGQSFDEVLKDISLLILSPDVPLDKPLVAKARKRGIEIIGEIELAYRVCKADIIAVTGTNGKTTTTSMIYQMLKKVGLNCFALGNIGTPFSDLALELKYQDVVALEVSSFQLESIEDFCPKIAVFLNITPDHIERHGSMEEYLDCKKAIFCNSGECDYIVLNYDDPIVRACKEGQQAEVFFFSRKGKVKGCYLESGELFFSRDGETASKICKVDQLSNVKGLHNIENALACLCVGKILDFPSLPLVKALKDFTLPRHRIEFVAKINNVCFFDDSKGTNIDATIRACEAMKGSTALIVGGYDKGYAYGEFYLRLPKNIKKIICLGANKKQIICCANDEWKDRLVECETLANAVKIAADSSCVNVLFSPTTSSFDSYKNYEERGEAFAKVVKDLINA